MNMFTNSLSGTHRHTDIQYTHRHTYVYANTNTHRHTYIHKHTKNHAHTWMRAVEWAIAKVDHTAHNKHDRHC